MNPLFEILWIAIALSIVVFIRRINPGGKTSYKLGFRLILLSFLCGLVMLAIALFSI